MPEPAPTDIRFSTVSDTALYSDPLFASQRDDYVLATHLSIGFLCAVMAAFVPLRVWRAAWELTCITALLACAAITSPIWLLWLVWRGAQIRHEDDKARAAWPDFTRQSECEYLRRLHVKPHEDDAA